MTERVQPASKFTEVNGLRVHYLEWGKADLPVVVCVHGYTSSEQAFNALGGTSTIDIASSLRMCADTAKAHGRLRAGTGTRIRPAIWLLCRAA
jgi:pimeloyl-ACP methyl ester carboxylesterase